MPTDTTIVPTHEIFTHHGLNNSDVPYAWGSRRTYSRELDAILAFARDAAPFYDDTDASAESVLDALRRIIENEYRGLSEASQTVFPEPGDLTRERVYNMAAEMTWRVRPTLVGVPSPTGRRSYLVRCLADAVSSSWGRRPVWFYPTATLTGDEVRRREDLRGALQLSRAVMRETGMDRTEFFELARLLLSAPDVSVSAYANGSTAAAVSIRVSRQWRRHNVDLTERLRGMMNPYSSVCSMELVCSGCGDLVDQRCACSALSYVDQPHPLPWHGEPTATIPRYVGCELEICSFDYDEEDSDAASQLCDYLISIGGGLKYDGSLPSTGREIVLPPMRGADAIEIMRNVTSYLDALGATVDSDAGGHVHVDTRDFTRDKSNALLALWWALEEPIVNLLCPGRTDGDYCRSMEPTPISRELLADALTADHLSEHGRTLFECSDASDRYVTLNMANMRVGYYSRERARGTVEFRLWPGVVGFDRLYVHAAISAQIVEYVATTPSGDIAATVARFAHDREGLLAHIVDSETMSLARRLPDSDCERGYSDDMARGRTTVAA